MSFPAFTRKWPLMVLALLLIVSTAGCLLPLSNDETDSVDTPDTDLETHTTPVLYDGTFESSFASYVDPTVEVTPAVPSYTIEADLSNVVNAESDNFYLPDVAKEKLAANGFVVEQGYHSEFFSLYESNRYQYIPNFITTDSILHNYHLLFDDLLKSMEEDYLAAELEALNASMLATSLEQYEQLAGTEWETAAQRVVGFFVVGSRLMGEDLQVPEAVMEVIGEELALIEAHEGITASPLINLGNEDGSKAELFLEDYSQYIPRGHYDKSDLLKAYFKTMMWYGRLNFRLNVEDEVKSAILITLALQDGDNATSWNRIYEPTNFLVGKSDDVTYYDFQAVVAEVYGDGATVASLTDDATKVAEVIELSKALEPPQINSIPVFSDQDREEAIKGFRFMGQRFTVDAMIFQRLIDREVTSRMLPKGLDIPAAMGSEEALAILEEMGETDYENYSTQMDLVKTYLESLPTDVWTQNVYWSWLYSLQPLLTTEGSEKGEGYPFFMTNTAWIRKELNTFLGSWMELKHDTILYAKQAYAELGGGPEIIEGDDRGYVEPNPDLYARLAALLAMTREGLNSRDLITDNMSANLELMETLATSLKTISIKELQNETLTDDEYELIRSYGGQLEHLWLAINSEDMEAQGLDQQSYLYSNPAAIVADVATDPNGYVLEEAIGDVNKIYVVVPVDGELKIAVGGVFSYYEFPWPLSDRLTDDAWRELLNEWPPQVEVPTWTEAFLTD